MGYSLMSSDKSEKLKHKRKEVREEKENKVLSCPLLVVNVACSVGGAAADMALSYTGREINNFSYLSMMPSGLHMPPSAHSDLEQI